MAVVWAAVITAIVGPVVTFVITRVADRRFSLFDRRKALNGRWHGAARQEKGPRGTPLDFSVEVTLSIKAWSIAGELTTNYELDGKTHIKVFDVSGGTFFNDYARLEYAARDSSVFQFGTIMLRLLPDGRTLKGSYLGYGAISDDIITGDVELQRS